MRTRQTVGIVLGVAGVDQCRPASVVDDIPDSRALSRSRNMGAARTCARGYGYLPDSYHETVIVRTRGTDCDAMRFGNRTASFSEARLIMVALMLSTYREPQGAYRSNLLDVPGTAR